MKTNSHPQSTSQCSSYRETWQAHSGATAKQLDFIHGLAEQEGVNTNALATLCQKEFKVRRMDDLSRKEASTLIEALKESRGGRR